MKNKSQVMERQNQIRIPDWIYLEIQEDDFLLGKDPHDFQEIMEEEE